MGDVLLNVESDIWALSRVCMLLLFAINTREIHAIVDAFAGVAVKACSKEIG